MRDWGREIHEAVNRAPFALDERVMLGDVDLEEGEIDCSEWRECVQGGGCNPENCPAYSVWREGCR